MNKLVDLFWGVIVLAMFLVGLFIFIFDVSESANPTPPLAIYINTTDPYDAASGGRLLSGARLRKKWLAVKAKSLSCGYFIQEKLLSECDRTQLVELDYNDQTMEVLVMSQRDSDCNATSCNVWLLQTSLKHFSAFADVAGNEEQLAEWVYKADIISVWKRVITPIEIHAENYAGWRQLRVQYQGGKIEKWHFNNAGPKF